MKNVNNSQGLGKKAKWNINLRASKRILFFRGCIVGLRFESNFKYDKVGTSVCINGMHFKYSLPFSHSWKKMQNVFHYPLLQIFSWLKQAGWRPPRVCNSKLHRFLERPCYQQYIYANDIIYSRAAQGLLSVADSSKHFGNCYAPDSRACGRGEYIHNDKPLSVRGVSSQMETFFHRKEIIHKRHPLADTVLVQ